MKIIISSARQHALTPAQQKVENIKLFKEAKDSILDKFSSFESERKIEVEIANAGYFNIKPDPEEWINPGDFLGFSGGIIGYR